MSPALPPQVGRLMPIDLLPPAYVRFRLRLMVVPQTKLFEVWILNGVAFVPLASMARFEYAELPCVIVTLGVVVVSVAEIAVSFAQPLFLTATLTLMHSFLLMTPLLLPLTVSSIVTPFDCRFDAPDMQKFWVVVEPEVEMTETLAGDALERLRCGSAAVAV